jgi:hypothetical protein
MTGATGTSDRRVLVPRELSFYSTSSRFRLVEVVQYKVTGEHVYHANGVSTSSRLRLLEVYLRMTPRNVQYIVTGEHVYHGNGVSTQSRFRRVEVASPDHSQ